MRLFRRLLALAGALLVVLCLVPVQSFALDPVTDTVIINAWAQAVAAYGAAHGVTMGFDVSDSDQIGEGVHALWNQYVSEVSDSDVPTYNSAALNWWANAYKKVGDSVGISFSSGDVSVLDKFWNWLLSGPAEIVKVDNQYVWPVDEQTGDYEVIPVHEFVVLLPIRSSVTASASAFNSSFYAGYVSWKQSGYDNETSFGFSAKSSCYAFVVSGSFGKWYFASPSTTEALIVTSTYSHRWNTTNYATNNCLVQRDDVDSGLKYGEWLTGYGDDAEYTYYLPVFGTFSDGMQYASDVFARGGNDGVISLAPDGVVDIPDNEDVNYDPLPVDIGIDIPWIWGEGDTPLTQEQKQGIVEDIGDQIVEDGEITVDEEATDDPDNPTDDDEPIGEAGDYVVAGLENVFPFCIPFDIYHFLSALAATPQPPSFSATLEFPEMIGGTKTIELDFDTPTFNRLAEILRLLELLAFIVGLAFVTRSMFVRG